MGREVRRVPKDWQHPKESNGQFKPLHEGSRYHADKMAWEATYEAKGLQAAMDDHGNPPDIQDYMPHWTVDQQTHLMMYEDTTEGTPISPAFETPEELARWLADNKASALGRETATYEQWLATIRDGFAVSMVVENGVAMSGVEFAARKP